MNYYSSKRSSNNFARKLRAVPNLPEHMVRSKRTQEAIQESQKFYKDNIEKQKFLLEQQLAYKQKEAERPLIDRPSNVITLKNGTQWYFDKNLNKFINVLTQEELTVDEFHVYTTMVALDINRDDLSDGGGKFEIKSVTIVPSTPNANGIDSVTAIPEMYGSSRGVSFTYRWTYIRLENPDL